MLIRSITSWWRRVCSWRFPAAQPVLWAAAVHEAATTAAGDDYSARAPERGVFSFRRLLTKQKFSRDLISRFVL